MKKRIKNDYDDKTGLFIIDPKSIINRTVKIVLKSLYFIVPTTISATLCVGFFNLGKSVARRYYYERTTIDNNGNEISSELTTDVHSNSIKVYNGCYKANGEYIKTYDTYYSNDIDKNMFLNTNIDDLVLKLGNPSDSGYEVDNRNLDLDKEYAYYIMYNKTDKEYKEPNEDIKYLPVYLFIAGAVALIGFASVCDADVRGKFEMIDSSDIFELPTYVKSLKKKRKEDNGFTKLDK